MRLHMIYLLHILSTICMLTETIDVFKMPPISVKTKHYNLHNKGIFTPLVIQLPNTQQ